jgi:hypothetical protein
MQRENLSLVDLIIEKLIGFEIPGLRLTFDPFCSSRDRARAVFKKIKKRQLLQ